MEIGIDDSDYYSEGSVGNLDEVELPYDVGETEPEGVKAIFDAVRRGDVDETRMMLDREAVLLGARRGGPDGDPLLLAAAEWGQLSIVKLLLERGATVDQPGRDGWTALHAATYRGHETMLDLLVEKGANARAPASYGSTTLMLAAGSVFSGPGMIKKLLQLLHGQDINQVNDLSETALFWACFWGRTDTIRLLLMAGADPSIVNENSETPRQAAVRRGHQECVDMLEWWEGELERTYVLHRARLLSERHSAAPPFLMERVAKECPIPRLEVVQPEEGEGGASVVGPRSASARSGLEDPEGRERDAMLRHAMAQLNPHLYTELIQGMGLHMAMERPRT